MLYTSLYHTLMNPSVYADVDGHCGSHEAVHQQMIFMNYNGAFCLDTYRALHPLFNIINRERSTDMVRSMIAHSEQSVHKALPVWCSYGKMKIGV